MFQSARPARGATQASGERGADFGVSIRTPREGRDSMESAYMLSRFTFQSARPARGATLPMTPTVEVLMSFNPHAPRGARPEVLGVLAKNAGVSIRTPREGRDWHSD